MAGIHRGLEQGRLLLGFCLFRHLMRSQVPHPDKYSSCDNECSLCFLYSYILRPDIPCTRWSSRPDTVFLRESWGLLIDLPRSKLHTPRRRLIKEWITAVVAFREYVITINSRIVQFIFYSGNFSRGSLMINYVVFPLWIVR